jgi:hypothetical protein
MKRAIFVGLLVALAGCRSSLWKDVSEKPQGETERQREGRLCLGVTVPRDSSGVAIGVPIRRVLKESPADQCGLGPGDEIRSVGGRNVRSAEELDGVLRALRHGSGDEVGATDRPPSTVDIVVASCGEEHVVHCRLTTWGDQARLARERCETHAKVYESTFSIPLLVDYEKMSVPTDVFRDYYGRELSEPLLVYRDVDLVPLLGFFSLFRFESTSMRDAWRLQLLAWPLVFTWISDDEGLKELLAPGEDRLEVL